jgi:hypothetical protein
MKMNRHENLVNGVGLCSVPMYRMGMPAGFCDNLAYSERPDSPQYYNYCSGSYQRKDGRYNGHVPGLACPCHGGEKKERALNLCSYCKKCLADCDGDPKFGNGKGCDNVYECSKVEYYEPTN